MYELLSCSSSINHSSLINGDEDRGADVGSSLSTDYEGERDGNVNTGAGDKGSGGDGDGGRHRSDVDSADPGEYEGN